MEEHSDETLHSAVEAAIEFSKTLPQSNPEKQHENSDSEDSMLTIRPLRSLLLVGNTHKQ